MTTRSGWLLLTLYALLFFGFIYLPLLVIVGYSFNANPVNMMIWDGFTLDWYRGLLGLGERATDPNNRAVYVESTDQMISALKHSLTVALFTTTISTLIGTATAGMAAASPLFSGVSPATGPTCATGPKAARHLL